MSIFGSNLDIYDRGLALPVYPHKQTSSEPGGMSQNVPTVEVAVAAYSIAGAARRGGASLWKSCFAEAVDLDLR
jgi:hypothetical protein